MVGAGLTAGDRVQGIRFLTFGLAFRCTTGVPFLAYPLVSQAKLRVRPDVPRLEPPLAERDEARS